ncbi:hypothetical protein DENSPDRAFT_270254 [Dentipellis sp. KUC8613]|nr:hypothetical protein DENSPDRAFT_270254 [Dentipellis sp. KUC8613]
MCVAIETNGEPQLRPSTNIIHPDHVERIHLDPRTARSEGLLRRYLPAPAGLPAGCCTCVVSQTKAMWSLIAGFRIRPHRYEKNQYDVRIQQNMSANREEQNDFEWHAPMVFGSTRLDAARVSRLKKS